VSGAPNSLFANVPEDIPRHKYVCWSQGSHDFFEPVVVRQGAHLLHASAEVAIVVCRRCGSTSYLGWTETEE